MAVVTCVWASIDEHGNATGGNAGNQTGTEVRKGPWYQFGQNVIMRCTDSTKAAKIAEAALKTAANNNIGYDQSQRTTFYTAAGRVGWDPSKITAKVETDCSASVAVYCRYAGIPLSKDVYSGNLRAALTRTGLFRAYTGTGWTNTDANLKKGDIIIAPGKHVIVAVSDAPAPSNNKPTPKPTKSIDDIAKEVIEGKWGNGETRKSKLKAAGYDYNAIQKRVNEILKGSTSYSTKTVIAKAGLNVRKGPGTNYAKLKTLPYGSKVNCYTSKNGWWKISPKSDEWVYGGYVR